MPGEPLTAGRNTPITKAGLRLVNIFRDNDGYPMDWPELMVRIMAVEDEAAALPPVAPDGADPNMDYERRDAMLDVVRQTYAPDGADLDVETLARAMHEGPHHYRGGADDSLAKTACIQFGWQESQCLRRATALAERYRRLRAGEGGKG